MTTHIPTDTIRDTAALVAASQGRDPEAFRQLIKRASESPLAYLGAALALLSYYPGSTEDGGLQQATEAAIAAMDEGNLDGDR